MAVISQMRSLKKSFAKENRTTRQPLTFRQSSSHHPQEDLNESGAGESGCSPHTRLEVNLISNENNNKKAFSGAECPDLGSSPTGSDRALIRRLESGMMGHELK